MPRICFINKMDKMGADFDHAVDTIRKRLSAKPVPIQMPIGQAEKFKGCVDLFNMKAIYWHDETMGADYEVEEIPAELQKRAQAMRQLMVETIVENDDGDELMAKWIEGDEYFGGGAESITAEIRHCGQSFWSCWVRPSRTRACSRCWMRWSIFCLRRSMFRRSRVRIPTPGLRTASREGRRALLGAGFQDHDPPVCGTVDVLPGVLGRLKTSEWFTTPSRKHERIGRLLRMHANKREEIKRSSRAIFAPRRSEERHTGDTICDEDKPILLESIEFPSR